MKKVNYLALALALSLMFVALTACGNPAKDDLKEYINNNVNTVFIPGNNEIVEIYKKALESQDETTIINALKETLPTKSNTLLEKMKAFTPETAEVQELHNVYIKAVEIRKEGYVLMLEAFTTKVDDEAASEAALAKLCESDAKFTEFETKKESMMKDLGLVVEKE